MENESGSIGQGIDGRAFLSPREALMLLEEDAILVDLRRGPGRNGRSFGVGQVILLPFDRLESDYPTLPEDRRLILADCVGHRSRIAMEFLRRHGYRQVASLTGGMVDWERDGLPTTIDRDEELSGGCACKLKPRRVIRPRGGC